MGRGCRDDIVLRWLELVDEEALDPGDVRKFVDHGAGYVEVRNPVFLPELNVVVTLVLAATVSERPTRRVYLASVHDEGGSVGRQMM